MEERRFNTGTLIAGLAVLAFVLLGVYVAGYVLLSDTGIDPFTDRMFPNKYWHVFYQPAAKVESILIGRKVHTDYLGPGWDLWVNQ